MATRLRFDPEQRRRHKLRNAVHSVLLLGGMGLLLGVCAGSVWGLEGAFWAMVGGLLGFLLSPSVAPEWVMQAYRARPISRAQWPEGVALIERLAQRAELERVPRLYYLGSPLINSFAVGSPDRAAIAVTAGMLRTLDWRELAGVLAHELSHIRNNDLWLMGLADAMSRLTSLMAFFGIFLFFFNLPLMALGYAGMPWLAIFLLIFAPTIGSLLQLALSRAREFDADLEAASLTRDPAGLASALKKLERYQGRYWEEILLPGRRMPEPSLLRTHPPTEERIERLMSLYEEEHVPFVEPEPVGQLRWIAGDPFGQRPRWRWPGVWY